MVLDRHNRLCEVVINRPQKRNALGREAARLLLDTIEALTQEKSIRAIIVTGDGRDFCSGADIKERVSIDPAERFLHSRDIAACTEALASSRVPTIAAIEGSALGAGLEVA